MQKNSQIQIESMHTNGSTAKNGDETARHGTARRKTARHGDGGGSTAQQQRQPGQMAAAAQRQQHGSPAKS